MVFQCLGFEGSQLEAGVPLRVLQRFPGFRVLTVLNALSPVGLGLGVLGFIQTIGGFRDLKL